MTRISIGSAAAGLALAGASVLGTASTATAQDVATCAYAENCAVAVSDATPVPGQPVTFTAQARSFVAGSDVQFTVFGATRTIIAGSDGAASASVTVPSDQPLGRYTAVFEGQQSVPGTTGTDLRPNRLEISFTVVRAAGGSNNGNNGNGGASGGSLPRTGSSELVPIGIAGLTLVAAGAAVMVVARRRREHGTSAA